MLGIGNLAQYLWSKRQGETGNCTGLCAVQRMLRTIPAAIKCKLGIGECPQDEAENFSRRDLVDLYEECMTDRCKSPWRNRS